MTPLSKALTGLVIPNDSCVSHLNPSGETVDPELQKKNSKVAGTYCVRVWGNWYSMESQQQSNSLTMNN